LPAPQKQAASVAADLVADAEMRFVMMLFCHDGVGAVISNLEPAQSVGMIEQALKAAKASVEMVEIGRERLQ
jgi:hypothetical protein